MEDKLQELNTILDNIGWGRYSTFNFCVCGGAWLTLSYLNISISFLMRTAQNEWNLESYQVGLINASHMLGICIGSILFGFIGDRYGRVFTFKLSGLLSIAGSMILAFSPNYAAAIPLTLIAGMGGGGEITAGGPTYIEACPPKKRWTLVLISTCWVIGAIFAAFVALIFELSNNYEVWRGVYLVGAIIEFLWWIPRLLLYESTRFLLIHNKIEECENVLRNIAKHNRSEVSVNFDINADEVWYNETIQAEGPVIMRFREKNAWETLKLILSRKYFRYTMLFAITIVLNEIAFSTLLGFMPIFLDRVHAKIENDAQLYYTLIIQQSASLPGISLSSYLIETRLGRRWTVSLSFLFMGLSIFLFYSAINYPMLLVFSSIQTCFNYIGYSTWYAMVSEFFPTEIRSGALGWLSFCDKLFGLIAVSIIGVLLGLPGGLEISIFICSFSCICSGFISMLLPETKKINLL